MGVRHLELIKLPDHIHQAGGRQKHLRFDDGQIAAVDQNQRVHQRLRQVVHEIDHRRADAKGHRPRRRRNGLDFRIEQDGGDVNQQTQNVDDMEQHRLVCLLGRAAHNDIFRLRTVERAAVAVNHAGQAVALPRQAAVRVCGAVWNVVAYVARQQQFFVNRGVDDLHHLSRQGNQLHTDVPHGHADICQPLQDVPPVDAVHVV